MTLPNQKTSIIFAKTIFVLLISVVLYFLIHELSHIIALLLCNGELAKVSLTSMYVGGYVNSEYISQVAISSLIVPTIISCMLFFFKNFYISTYWLGFTFPSVLNAILGIWAIYFENTTTRSTYDVALAYDFAKFPNLVIIGTISLTLINIILLLLKIRQFWKAT